MFDQLVKRIDAVWIYTTGRFAEDRRAFLCDLSRGGRSLRTLRKRQQAVARDCRAGEHSATNADHGTADRPGSQQLGRYVLCTNFNDRNAEHSNKKLHLCRQALV